MKQNKTDFSEKWYEKFSKSTSKKTEKKIKHKSETVKNNDKEINFYVNRQKYYENKIFSVIEHKKMFDTANIPIDAKKVLEDFYSIVQSVQPLNSKQLAKVPLAIRDLSHELTDERDERYRSYMNEKVRLSSYIRYYMWWNLIRLTRLFAGLESSDFSLKDEDVCIDIGSGPLTCVISLWLARPELREKKLTWYCLDISQSSINLGEELFLRIAARTLAKSNNVPWKIVRVKGSMGTFIKQKASFVVCANMLNELLQNTDNPPDYSAKKYSEALLSYADKKTSVLVVEPGVPRSARLISLMRDCFLRKGFIPIAPCPHIKDCPMDGKKGGKWCNFAFMTDDVPEKLLKISSAAGIPKERAVLSFVFVTNKIEKKEGDVENKKFRIASDQIKLPLNRIGYYACSELGLVLAENKSRQNVCSGDLLTLNIPKKAVFNSFDKKTNALEIVF